MRFLVDFDARQEFERLVDWCVDLIEQKRAPGLIIGISGTDSIIAYLICARAFQRIGRPERVVGVHFGPCYPPPDRDPQQLEYLLSISPSYRWVQRVVLPWLEGQVPGCQLRVENGPGVDVHNDYQRWASLFNQSINNAAATEAYDEARAYWVVGTRNATEDALGSFSNISSAVSLQPLMHLWKSEILEMCKGLGVPLIAMQHSRQVDCDCGRFDLAADHIEEVDAILVARTGVADADQILASMDGGLRKQLQAFVEEQIAYAGFKKQIPYRPPVVRRS